MFQYVLCKIKPWPINDDREYSENKETKIKFNLSNNSLAFTYYIFANSQTMISWNTSISIDQNDKALLF
jgi:hypothetical protein